MRNRVLVEKTPDQFIAASLIAIHTWHRPLKLITTLAVVFPFNFLHSLLSSSSLLPWCTDKTDFCESRYRKYHISSHFLFLFSFVHFDFSLFHPIHIGISLYIIIISIAKTVCCVLNNPLHRKKDSFFSLSFNKKKSSIRFFSKSDQLRRIRRKKRRISKSIDRSIVPLSWFNVNRILHRNLFSIDSREIHRRLLDNLISTWLNYHDALLDIITNL